MNYQQLLERLRDDLPQSSYEGPGWITWIIYGLAALSLFPIAISCFVVTKQKTAKVIENLGKFKSVKTAGLSFKAPWPIGRVSGVVNLKLRELSDDIGVKSSDNAFLVVPVKAQFKVIREKIKESFYELESLGQIKSYIVNVVRSKASEMTMDEIFQSKDAMETEVMELLNEQFSKYGYEIVNVLVDDPQPSEELRQSFDRVLAAKRDQEASGLEKIAIKNRIVGKAEADAESLKLKAVAYVEMRKTMAAGNEVAISAFCADLDISHAQALSYFEGLDLRDTIRDASQSPGSIIITTGKSDGLDNMAAMMRSMQQSAYGVIE